MILLRKSMSEFRAGRYIFAPLEGLKIIPETIRFPDGLIICSTPEILEWNIGLKDLFSMPMTPLYCLQYFEPLPKKDMTSSISSEKQMEIVDRIEAIITLLRLYKQGRVGHSLVFSVKIFKHEESHIKLVEFFRYGSMIPILEASYEIQLTEIKDLISFWGDYYGKVRFPNKLRDEKLKWALSRFNLATLRFNPIEKILDLIITLEILFSRGSLRLAIEVATFLAKKGDEWVEIYDDVYEGYDLRSKIVHGGRTKSKDEKALHSLLPRLEEYARLGLKKAIDLNETKNERRSKIWQNFKKLRKFSFKNNIEINP